MTTYYLDKTLPGSNSNNGLSSSTPWLTWTYANTQIGPGDTLRIKGSYAEQLGLSVAMPSGSSWGSPVHFKAYDGELAAIVITGVGEQIAFSHSESYEIWEDILFDSGYGSTFCVGGNTVANHIRFINCDFTRSYRSGVLAGHVEFFEFTDCRFHHCGNVADPDSFRDHGCYWTGKDSTFDNCLFYSNSGYGLHIYNEPPGSLDLDRNTVKNCWIYDNGFDLTYGRGGGFIMTAGEFSVMYNCLLFGNAQTGASISESIPSNEEAIYNCVMFDNGAYGLLIGADAYGPKAQNNILFGNAAGAIQNLSSNSPVVDHNFTSDPDFVDSGADNFRLESTSGAIGYGVDLSAIFTTDIEGTTRTVPWDAGAYAFNGSPPPSGDLGPLVDDGPLIGGILLRRLVS